MLAEQIAEYNKLSESKKRNHMTPKQETGYRARKKAERDARNQEANAKKAAKQAKKEAAAVEAAEKSKAKSEVKASSSTPDNTTTNVNDDEDAAFEWGDVLGTKPQEVSADHNASMDKFASTVGVRKCQVVVEAERAHVVQAGEDKVRLTIDLTDDE
jgi:membrane protein involved in colicin uptake